jgi:hypothetical protein
VAVADEASRADKTGALRVRNLGDIRRRTRMSDVIERDDDMVVVGFDGEQIHRVAFE